MNKITLNLSLLFILSMLSINMQGQSNNSAPFCPGSFSASPCNQPAFSNFPSNTINDFIDSFVTTGAITNISNTNSGCNGLANNYIFYCTPYMLAIPGQVITCSVQSGMFFDQSFGLFIDWNQNNNFEIPSERVGATTSPPTAGSWFVMTFTVPSTQTNGQYRMRIRCYNTPSNTYVDPCGPAYVGETEDYSLYIGNSGPPPLSAFVSHNTPLCTGQTLNFIINHSGSNSTNFNWTGPGGFSSPSQNPVITNITPTLNGTYTVSIEDGACSIVKTIFVNVNPNPTITVNSATLCAGDPTTLTASGAASYTWSTGQTTASFSLTPITTSTFMVTGITNSCSSTKSTVINVVPTFTMSTSSTASLICAGTEVTVTATGASSYSWNSGQVTNTIAISPTLTTQYTVTGVVGPCTTEISYLQYVEDCSGLAERNGNSYNLHVFPNPFKNELIIKAPESTGIAIYNTLGQLLITVANNTRGVVDTENLPEGVYYISLANQEGSKVFKIIKN